jgi:Thiolase C-terminal domain-like
MELTGATPETFALVAVKNRRHAAHNPYAQYRTPLTVREVLDAPMVADPLTRLSCCPTGDGAAAAVVVSEAAARRLGRARMVRVAAASLASGGYRPADLASFDIDVRAARGAYELAGIDPAEVDLAEVHDAFTATEVIHYEDLLLCKRSDGPRMVHDGDTALGGRLPVSTSGGLLSKGHPLGATRHRAGARDRHPAARRGRATPGGERARRPGPRGRRLPRRRRGLEHGPPVRARAPLIETRRYEWRYVRSFPRACGRSRWSRARASTRATCW